MLCACVLLESAVLCFVLMYYEKVQYCVLCLCIMRKERQAASLLFPNDTTLPDMVIRDVWKLETLTAIVMESIIRTLPLGMIKRK